MPVKGETLLSLFWSCMLFNCGVSQWLGQRDFWDAFKLSPRPKFGPSTTRKDNPKIKPSKEAQKLREILSKVKFEDHQREAQDLKTYFTSFMANNHKANYFVAEDPDRNYEEKFLIRRGDHQDVENWSMKGQLVVTKNGYHCRYPIGNGWYFKAVMASQVL